MRLIGTIEDQHQARIFYAFLIGEEIESYCEPLPDSDGSKFWVIYEDKLESAKHWLEEFQKNPEDPRFKIEPHPIDRMGEKPFAEAPPQQEQEAPLPPRGLAARRPHRARAPLTRMIIILCGLIFVWNWMQSSTLEKEKSGARFFGFTPLFSTLSYDFPLVYQELVTFFESYKISEPKDIESLPPAAFTEFEKIDNTPHWGGF